MKRIFSITFASLLLLTVAACSIATVAYNNASTLALYGVNDYLDLTSAQEEWLKTRVNRLVSWHRANELPQYRRVLDGARGRVDASISVAELDVFYTDGKMLFARLADRALPDIADLLLQLEPAQIRFLEARLADDNKKMRRELATGIEQLQKKRIERYEQRFKDWMGTLADEQLADIRAVVTTVKPLEEFRLADRLARQAEFIDLIKSKPDSTTMQKELRVMLLQPELKRAPDYRDELTRQQRVITELVARMSVSATPAQRARVQKRLAGYVSDVASLLSAA